MSYRLTEADWLMSYRGEDGSWQAELFDEDDYLVCEVWNNGDGGGHFYAWHDIQARWAIVEEANALFADAEYPLDAWMESKKVTDEEN